MHVMDHRDPSLHSVLMRMGWLGAAFRSSAAWACGRWKGPDPGQEKEHGEWLVMCGNAFAVAVLSRVGREKPPRISDFFSMLTIFLTASFLCKVWGMLFVYFVLFFSKLMNKMRGKTREESVVWVSRDSLFLFFLCGGRPQVGAAVGTL